VLCPRITDAVSSLKCCNCRRQHDAAGLTRLPAAGGEWSYWLQKTDNYRQITDSYRQILFTDNTQEILKHQQNTDGDYLPTTFLDCRLVIVATACNVLCQNHRHWRICKIRALWQHWAGAWLCQGWSMPGMKLPSLGIHKTRSVVDK